MPRYAIGIDLGTTYSCVAVVQHGKVEVIANDQGNRITPSFVSFNEEERLIGDSAKNEAALNPTNTVYDVKRLIGHKYDEPSVQSDLKHWSFTVVDHESGPKVQVKFKNDTLSFTPEEISAMVLSKMKETAEDFLAQEVKDAVITVPAYFNDSQRQATKDAGRIAGLNVLRIINEPTAAAVAYGLQKRKGEGECCNVLVYDLGGGTFDVSILSIEDRIYEVKSTAGDSHLGGEDFDNVLVSHFMQEFKNKHKKDLTGNKKAIRRLRTACEKAKRALSASTIATIQVDSLYEGIDFSSRISRAKFEELCQDLFNITLQLVETALNGAKLVKNKIDEVVLIGGSTRIPKIQNMLKNFFDGKTIHKSVNPDEAVAYGAAIQAGILTEDNTVEEVEKVLLKDVTPLSLGVALISQEMSVIIPKCTTIPAKLTRQYQTSLPNQTAIGFRVYQGERAKSTDNHYLGLFSVCDIPPLPKGEAKVDVTFDLDSNCILKVTALSKSTNKTTHHTVTSETGRLSTKEINRMVNDAKKFKAEDDRHKKRFAAMNSLETYSYEMAAKIGEIEEEGSISKEDSEAIKNECDQTIQWIESNRSAKIKAIKKKQEKLENLCKSVTQYHPN